MADHDLFFSAEQVANVQHKQRNWQLHKQHNNEQRGKGRSKVVI